MSGITQALMGGYSNRLPIEVAYIGNTGSTTNSSSYNFASQNIGTASSDRIVVVGVSLYDGGPPSSVTIGGVSASKLNTAGAGNASLWAASVPTGSTATISVVTNSTASCCGIAIWTLKNTTGYAVEAKPNAANSSNTAASETFTFASVNKGDALIVMSRIRSANAGTYSVTGATERFDLTVESGVSGHFGADAAIATSTSNYNVVVSTSGTSPTTNTTVTRFYIP